MSAGLGKPKVLITGAAGFIGFHLAARLLSSGSAVVGFDAMTDYYDPELKRARLGQLQTHHDFSFFAGRLEERESLATALAHGPDIVLHLAAQAGVRYSLTNPESYLHSNIVGTFNLLELLKAAPPKHLLLASTSSVYGGNPEEPFGETDRTDFPLSLYAATKKSCEAMCHSYAHLFGIPTTAMRFFTVYGPWGRPDMALFKFVRAMLTDASIEIYGDGRMYRDFTYIDDLVDDIVELMDLPPSATAAQSDSLSPVAPYRTVNLGGGSPVALMDYIAAIEAALGREAKKTFLPMQPGDVVGTSANTQLLFELVGKHPRTSVQDGVARFVEWYRIYYQV